MNDPIADKRQAILEATLRLVTTNGFHATPMSLIAKEAQVAAGTIYHYFTGKDDLVCALYAEVKARMGQALLQGQAGQGHIRDRFFQLWRNLYDFFVSHPQEFAFLEQCASAPFIPDDIKAANEHYYRPGVDFLAEGMAAGVLRPMELPLMLALVYGHITTVAKMALLSGGQLPNNWLAQAIQSSWDGVRIN
jgi:AcrR family transcriptional regulator